MPSGRKGRPNISDLDREFDRLFHNRKQRINRKTESDVLESTTLTELIETGIIPKMEDTNG